LILIALFSFYHFELGEYLSFEFLKKNQYQIQQFYQDHRLLTLVGYFFLYVLVTGLSLPGALIMTLAGGALFGLVVGTLVISFASTLGATLAFILSRFLFRQTVQYRFHKQLRTINKGIKRDGAFYLFTLRLIPLFPFFIINLVMGLTPMKTVVYIIVSQIGMLPGTLLYVNAGNRLGQISSPEDILSLKIIISFTLLGIFPLMAKLSLHLFKDHRLYKKFTRPRKYDYNLVVIGAGSAGLVASYMASLLKAKVALIEKNKMGGDCLNTGCVPSKALIKTAKILHQAKNSKKYGIPSMKVDFSFTHVMDRVKKIIKEIEPHDSVQRYNSLGVECIQGKAHILSPWEIKVGEKTLTSKNIIIATGARPNVPDYEGLNQLDYLTSDNLWNLKELPKKLLILGAGPIGCEMAQAFSRLGSQVTIIQRNSRILPKEDGQVSSMIQKVLTDEGIEILTNHQPIKFYQKEGKNLLLVEHNSHRQNIIFDRILLATGRRANIEGFGLKKLGITLRENKSIGADPFLRTNFKNIFVCGDVTGPYQFTHTAAHQAWYATINALFGKLWKFKVDYSVIPWCTFTDPEVASVGLNELRAKKLKIAYELVTFDLKDLDRAITDSETNGTIRVLIRPHSDKILGATIVGHQASYSGNEK
jgi:pyruvate/2-oxoglutarate dehydrogenase complex dihydrolipoamide dehydrogenase (E3) component/uncharacterized membrane protein YdjX (TVP38/TMEM64 family)